MKPNIHPEYSEVAFKDNSADKTFIIRTTLKPRETIVIDGKTYPLLNLDVSSASHTTDAPSRLPARPIVSSACAAASAAGAQKMLTDPRSV